MVTQKKDPDSQDAQGKDERQQIQTRHLPLRCEEKTLPSEDGQTLGQVSKEAIGSPSLELFKA